MITKLFSVVMAILLSAGSAGAITQPTHVDMELTPHGVQLDYEDGTSQWLAFPRSEVSPISLEDLDYLETEELFLMEMAESGLTDYVLYDASEMTEEVLANRQGTVIIERCIGFVTNGETGDGELLNPADPDYAYISYADMESPYRDGTVILNYLIYPPECSAIDDISARHDIVLTREFED